MFQKANKQVTLLCFTDDIIALFFDPRTVLSSIKVLDYDVLLEMELSTCPVPIKDEYI